MSDLNTGTNSLKQKPEDENVTPELSDVVDPMDETDDYPTDDELLDEELEGSFPASDPPSSTPTTSIGAPQHDKDRS